MSDPKLRKLGVMERYHATRHFMGMDACVVTSARYTIREKTALTKELLFPALRTVIEAHALLGVRFNSRDDSVDVAYLRLPSVDLTRVVEFSKNTDLQDALAKQLSRRFEDTQGDLPLWRLEVLPDNTVILAMHHAIGDGLSTATFHDTLIRALQETPLPSYSSAVTVPIDLPVLAPIEDVTDVRPSFFNILAVLYDSLWPWGPKHYAWTGHPVPTVVAIKTNVRLLSFKPSDAKRFSDACRAHSASVTSALYELAVSVLSRLLANDPVRHQTISMNIPISLRQVAGQGFHELCNYTSSDLTYAPVHTEFSWTRATSYAAELQVAKTKARERMGFMGWVSGNLPGFMKGQLGVKRMFGIIISNLGRFQAPAVEGNWEIGEMWFTQCDSLAGAALGLEVVGDATGALNIAFTWGDESVDKVLLEAFIPMFHKSLEALLL
ncbi:alcohol acetyltransferase [Mycena capillaripes]|nr:alcohol acetyltransferase [Mycena capillaripes]